MGIATGRVWVKLDNAGHCVSVAPRQKADRYVSAGHSEHGAQGPSRSIAQWMGADVMLAARLLASLGCL